MSKGELNPEQYLSDYYCIYMEAVLRKVCIIHGSSTQEVDTIRDLSNGVKSEFSWSKITVIVPSHVKDFKANHVYIEAYCVFALRASE